MFIFSVAPQNLLCYNDNRVSVGKIFISELESDSEVMLTDDDMGYNMYFKIVK